ncbi:SHOCT domain-containing protein [Nocardiopsis sp. CNT-189]|uniref:SHOCT domain-containing protein n=1 Tax=Nocardiopsis TaxID=2013 RepID=UPI00036BFB4D|nr:SHOCT domain-containing protein [Nocardiopsis potens]
MPMMAVFVAAVAVIAVVLVVAVAIAAERTPSAPPPEEPRRDPAMEELRRRYAEGEIGREEFLQRKIDLEE